MKNILFTLFILISFSGISQKYIHVGDTPFQLKLAEGYYFDGVKYTKENSKYTYKDYCNLLTNRGFPSSNNITVIDTTEFRSVTYFSKEKIKKIEYLDIDKYKASLIYTENEYGYSNYLFVVYENQVYFVNASTSLSKKNELDVQIEMLKTAKFIPQEIPDAIKDASFTFDESILKNMEPWKEFGYPQIYFKLKNSYTADLRLNEVRVKLPEPEIENLINLKGYSSLHDLELDTIVDAEIAGLKGKQIIKKGINYKNELKLEYTLLLFAPDSSFYIELSYETANDIDKNISTLFQFIGSIKLKENALTSNKLIGTWKIIKIDKTFESDKCSDKLIGKELVFTENKLSMHWCEDNKTVNKKLSYDIKHNKLIAYDTIDIDGTPSSAEYTCTGLMPNKNTVIINFWKIGLIELLRIK